MHSCTSKWHIFFPKAKLFNYFWNETKQKLCQWKGCIQHNDSRKPFQSLSPKFSDTQEQYLPFFLITFIILLFAGKEIDQIKHFSILRGSTTILHVTWPELQCNFPPHSKHSRESQNTPAIATGILCPDWDTNVRTHQCSQTKRPSTLDAHWEEQ